MPSVSSSSRRRRHVQQRLGSGGHDQGLTPNELAEVGRDVGRLLPSAVHAAQTSRAEKADARRTADGEGSADGRRADGALHRAGGEVARAGLARVGREPLQLLGAQPDPDPAVEHADRRRNRTGCTHATLGLEPDLDPAAGREPVRHERRLERDDGASCLERLVHLGRELKQFVHCSSMSMNSTSPQRSNCRT